LLPALLEAFDAASGSDKVFFSEPVFLLKQWNRHSEVHSFATTLAIEWGTRMAQFAPVAKLPEDGSKVVDNVDAEIRNASPDQRLHALNAAMDSLEARFGTWKVAWGDICRYQRLTGRIQETYDDRLPSLPVGLVSSAFGALPSVQSRYIENTKKRYAYSGNSFIAAVEFGKKLHARSIVTGGESSDPASPHFSDQIDGYLHGQFKEVLFYKEDVEKNKEKSYRPGEE
jgi:acyl-homoserine lactone acylase PvdQ